jgi:hypothetical protein
MGGYNRGYWTKWYWVDDYWEPDYWPIQIPTHGFGMFMFILKRKVRIVVW